MGITYRLTTGPWETIQYFTTPPKYFDFSESDEFIIGYEQPMIVRLFGITANPTAETITTPIASVSTPVNVGSAFTLDASPTEFSKQIE